MLHASCGHEDSAPDLCECRKQSQGLSACTEQTGVQEAVLAVAAGIELVVCCSLILPALCNSGQEGVSHCTKA